MATIPELQLIRTDLQMAANAQETRKIACKAQYADLLDQVVSLVNAILCSSRKLWW